MSRTKEKGVFTFLTKNIHILRRRRSGPPTRFIYVTKKTINSDNICCNIRFDLVLLHLGRCLRLVQKTIEGNTEAVSTVSCKYVPYTSTSADPDFQSQFARIKAVSEKL